MDEHLLKLFGIASVVATVVYLWMHAHSLEQFGLALFEWVGLLCVGIIVVGAVIRE